MNTTPDYVFEDCDDAARELRNAREHLEEVLADPDAEQPDLQHAQDRIRWAAEALRDIAAGIVADMEA